MKLFLILFLVGCRAQKISDWSGAQTIEVIESKRTLNGYKTRYVNQAGDTITTYEFRRYHKPGCYQYKPR